MSAPQRAGWAASDYDAEIRVSLTDKQIEGLLTAWRMGYFANPRQSTMTEVAQQLDIHQSSATRRVKVAVGAIVSEFVGELGDEMCPACGQSLLKPLGDNSPAARRRRRIRLRDHLADCPETELGREMEHPDDDLAAIADEIGAIEEVREEADGRVVVVAADRGRAEEERELRRQLEADVDGGPR